MKLYLTCSITNVQTQDFHARVKINSHKLIIFCGNVKWEGKKRPTEKHLFLEASNNYANWKSFPKRVCSKNLRKNTKLFELIFPDSGVFPTSRLNIIYLKHSLYICPHQIVKVKAFLILLWFSIWHNKHLSMIMVLPYGITTVYDVLYQSKLYDIIPGQYPFFSKTDWNTTLKSQLFISGKWIDDVNQNFTVLNLQLLKDQ